MTDEQRNIEAVKCYHEVFKTWQTIQDYSKEYDLICYNEEKEYVDQRSKLKTQIENNTKRLEFLTIKRSILLDRKIDLRNVESVDLEDCILSNKFCLSILDNI